MKMYIKLSMLAIFIFISCHKDIMLKQGFVEIKMFDYKFNEEENKLDIKFWLAEVPLDSVTNVVVKLRAEGIDMENSFNNPTVILDSEENSLHKGSKCIEQSWIPALTTKKENIEKIRLYVK